MSNVCYYLSYSFLAILVIAISGCSSIKYDEREAKQLMDKGEVDIAVTHYTYLAEFGLPSAQEKLAKIYYRQSKDKEAQYWLNQAALNNSDISIRSTLARLYAFSDDPSVRDTQKAYSMFYDLMDEGYEYAVSDLVQMYRSGLIEEIPVAHIQKFEQEAELKHDASCYLMAELYATGVFVTQHIPRAYEYYQCAYKTYPFALYYMSLIQDKYPELGSFEEIYTALDGIDDKERSRVSMKIANSIAKDEIENWSDSYAERLFLKASAITPNAFHRLARLYIHKPLLGKSKDDIISTLKKGQALDDIDCYALEAELYLYGKMVIQDPWKAESILLSQPSNHPYIAFLLGDLYSEGYMGNPNISKGLDYLNSSSAQSYRRADRRLSELYFEGRGMPSNPYKALTHLLLITPSQDRIDFLKMKYVFSDHDLEKARENALNIQQTRSTTRYIDEES